MSREGAASARYRAISEASSRTVRRVDPPVDTEGKPLPISAFFGCIAAPVMVQLRTSHQNFPSALIGSNQVAVHCAHRPSTALDIRI